jgi:glycosyltransferase involved in cell wall biosynthesis
MRILTLTNMYPTDAHPAFGTFVSDQVAALRRHPRVQRCDVMFIDGRARRSNYLTAVPRLARIVAKRPVDVIYAHYGLTGAIAVSQRRVPTVVTYHTGDLELTRWQRAVSRMAYRLASDNICVSNRAMQNLPGPAHHLTCGLDLTVFGPRDRAEARSRFGVEPDEVALLFPSSPQNPKKAYPRFAAVVGELRRRGHRVRELHLRGLTRAEVPTIMAAADAMVLTSLQEGSPVAVMEALATGLGVVATPVGDIEQMLAGAENARVQPFELASFADAAEAVLAAAPAERRPDPQSRRFSDTTITDRLVEILERASAQPRAAGASTCA